MRIVQCFVALLLVTLVAVGFEGVVIRRAPVSPQTRVMSSQPVSNPLAGWSVFRRAGLDHDRHSGRPPGQGFARSAGPGLASDRGGLGHDLTTAALAIHRRSRADSLRSHRKCGLTTALGRARDRMFCTGV